MAQSNSPMVQVKSLRKDFGPTRAVADISFEVNKGEIVGFLGPNGAGKTTTMRMLTGFLRPTAGTARIGGIEVGDDRLGAQRLIGYLPESAPLYEDMMVVDFLDYVSDLRGVEGDGRQKRKREICERCGLMNVLGKDIGQLSKGYRQRVGLAQAMIHDPDLLILDEPTSGLDPNQIVEIRQLIKDLGREKTVLLSTHILPEVQATCGRIIIISDGKLVADDTPEALTERDAGSVIHLVVKGREAVVDAARVQGALSALPGVRSVETLDGEGAGTVGFRLKASGTADPREAVFQAAVQQGFVLLDMHRERVSLEDTFRRLTRGEPVEKMKNRSSSDAKEAAHA
jgi:ABC-2 type transport system ATP-binding protein